MISRLRIAAVCAVAALLLLGGCRRDMQDQPRYEPLEGSSFFADGRSSRPPVEGTVARGRLELDRHLHTGKDGEAFATTFPFPITEKLMERGRERYEIFCSPCHDRIGTGRGMVVRRGLSQAASFHDDRLRKAEVGYFFDVISNGFGRMYSYSAQIPDPADRWKIVAYIRALQLSQSASIEDVPVRVRDELMRGRER